jgi:hypothetical protein
MPDVEVIDRADIVRREVDRESNERALAVMDPAILDTMFASRDPKAIVQRIADVADVLMNAVHQRDLARRYGDNPNEFLHIEAWQFLSSMLGMTVVGVDSRPLADGSGWEATAELRHVASGRVLGRRDGMCQKTEPTFAKRKTPPAENTLRQMAQLRAARVAARSVLGFIPKIGGFEITDPDAPATDAQVGILHQLERELGLDHDQGHAEAGVDSYRALTRDEASDVIDRWQARLQGGGAGTPPTSTGTGERGPRPEPSDATSASSGVGAEESPGDASVTVHGEGATTASDSGDSSPASPEAWARAPKDMTLSGAVKLATKMRATGRFPGSVPKTKSGFTGDQLARVGAAWRDGERG